MRNHLQWYTLQQNVCSRVGVYWCFTSHATIFQSYMWRHRCAGGLNKLYLRSGSQRHRHFGGFFNVSVLHRHGTTLFIRWFRHTALFSRLLRHAGDMEDLLPSNQFKSMLQQIWKKKNTLNYASKYDRPKGSIGVVFCFKQQGSLDPNPRSRTKTCSC